MEITDEQRRLLHRAGRQAGRLAREKVSTDNELRVAAFAPGGLTRANFEDALHAAVAAARAITPSPAVRIPAGTWPLTRSLYIEGNGYDPMPLIIGEGRTVTVLEWPDAFTGVCVELDGSRSHYAEGGLWDLAIRSAGGHGRGVGLRFTHLLFTSFFNISVSGFCDFSNDGWEHGIGIWARANYGAVENNQNVVFENTIISRCTTGARLAGCTQFTLNHVQFSTDYATATLWSDGTNWWRVS